MPMAPSKPASFAIKPSHTAMAEGEVIGVGKAMDDVVLEVVDERGSR